MKVKAKIKTSPCPFCGGNGAYTFFPITNSSRCWAKVECQDCGGMARVSQNEIEETEQTSQSEE